MIKQRKDAKTCGDKKRKGKTRKNNYTTWGNKPESTGERKKIKNISSKGKAIQNRTFQNNEKKFYLQMQRDDTKTYQQPD